MPMAFTRAPAFEEGTSLFLGLNADNTPAGIVTPRHLITIAGARSGKGAGLIIPNLLQWSAGSVLVIDPKGENAAASWEAREAMGHSVHVVDPFRVADVPDRLRSALNPLDAVDPSSLHAREDIRVIADGLVMRYNAKDAMWDNGAVSVLSGMIAHTLTAAPPERRNLPAVRSLLRWTDEQLEDVWNDMAGNPAIGGLAEAAASVGLSSAKSAREFVKGARDNTEWLDSEAMRQSLGHSNFKLADLKNGKTAVFLVLPPHYIKEHGRFLRLFVRCALDAMAKGGQGGGRCLFLLDEFHSLGHIDEIATAAGLMPAYGVHLWPFVQDLGQLVTLYGKEGAETFFGNADAHIFFGNTDPLTLDHISIRLGRYGHDDISTSRPFPVLQPPPVYRGSSSDPLTSMQLQYLAHDADMLNWEFQREESLRAHHENAAYEADARKIGQPRFPPETVREMVAKHSGDALARSMLVFGTGGRVHRLRPFGWWMELPEPITPAAAAPAPAPKRDYDAELRATLGNMEADTQALRKQGWGLIADGIVACVIAWGMMVWGRGWVDTLAFGLCLVAGLCLAVGASKVVDARRQRIKT